MNSLIKNAKVITPFEIIENCSIVIEDGIIKEIGKSISNSSYDFIYDASGMHLSPGFIDLHNHGNSGHDAMEGTRNALESMAEFHIKNGTTGFLATTVTASTEDTLGAIKNAVEFIRNDHLDINVNRLGAKVLGLYIEGPYFSKLKKGAQPEEFIKMPEINEIKEFMKVAEGNIKVFAIAPELDGALDAIKILKSNNITVTLAHTNASFEEAKKAIDMGASEVTHLYNGMRSFSHREPGIIGAVLLDERVSCEIICDGIHLHQGAMEMAVRLKGKDNVLLITDSMMATGLKDGEYSLGNQKVIVKNREARLYDGTLAGSTLTLNRAVYNMVHLVGTPLQDAIRMATLNPSRAIKMNDRKGSVEIGKDADLIVFDDNIDIKAAFIGGRMIFNK
jgi:N-acetylglucosamine-6-phosphate deacetylase